MKEKLNTNCKYIRVGIETKLEIGKTIINLGTDPLVGIEINLAIEPEEIKIETIVGPIIEIGQETTTSITVEETTTDQMVGETIIDQTIGVTITDQMIGETITDKTIEGTIIEIDLIMEETINRDIGLEVKVGRIQEIIIERIQEEDMSEKEVEIEVVIDKCDQE